MKQFMCGDVVPGCTHVFREASAEEILRAVAAHARRDHGLPSVPDELVDRVRRSIVTV